MDIDLCAVLKTAVQQCFFQTLIRIFILDIFAHQPDLHRPFWILQAVDHIRPARHVAGFRFEMQQAQGGLVHFLLGETEGHFVNRIHIAGGDDAFRRDIAEQADLLLNVLREGTLGTAEQNIRLDSERTQFFHAVLGGLCLHLLRGGDPRHQSDVDEDGVFATDFMPHLPDGLNEWQGFDIAHGAANLNDHHIDIGRDAAHGSLYFIGDMGNHLDGFAEIITAPFAGDDLFVNAARSNVVALGEMRVSETLVVAEVEIGLSTIVGDEDFAVLERTHRSGVYVQVGVEFLQGDAEPPAFEQTTNGGGGNPFSKRRNYAAGDEYIFSHFARGMLRTISIRVQSLPGYPPRWIRIQFRPRGWSSHFQALAVAPGAPPFRAVPLVDRSISTGNRAGIHTDLCV